MTTALPEGWTAADATTDASALPEGWSAASDSAPALPDGWTPETEKPGVLARIGAAMGEAANREQDAAQLEADTNRQAAHAVGDTAVRLAKSAVDATGKVVKAVGRFSEQQANLLDRINPLVPAGSQLQADLATRNREMAAAPVAAGEAVSRLADYYRPDPTRDNTLGAHLAEFVGSAAPVVASGPLALATGAGLMGEQAREAALKAGDSEEVANAKFILGTTVGAAAGAAPGSALLKRLVPAEAVLRAPVRAALTEVGAHAAAAGAVGAGADATLQALTDGRVDWKRAAETGGLTAVVGAIGGALKAAEAQKLAATDREGLFQLARGLGFEGNTLGELKQWHAEREAALEILAKGKQQNARRVAPEAAPMPEGWTPAEAAPVAEPARAPAETPLAVQPPEAPAATPPAAIPAGTASGGQIAPEGAPAPAVAGGAEMPLTPAQGKGKRVQFGARPDGATDIIDAIQEMGGVPKRPAGATGGEWDGHKETFQGPARLLLSRSTGKIDTWLYELAARHPQFANLAGNPDGFRAEVTRALEERGRLKRATAIEQQTNKFMDAALEGKGRALQDGPVGEPIATDELYVGETLKVKREHLEVTAINPDDGSVTLKDGPRFGTQIVPAGAVIYPDKGSYQPVPDKGVAQFLDETGGNASPASPAPPPGQADMFQGGETGGDTTFSLAGEQGKDFTGALDEKLAIEEAKRRQEAEQGKLFDAGDTLVAESPRPAAQMTDRPTAAQIVREVARTPAAKLEELRTALATPGTEIQYSVWDPEFLPPGQERAVQIDILPPPGVEAPGGLGSTTRAVLAHLGVDLPPAPDWLPAGRYTATEIAAAWKLGPPGEGSGGERSAARMEAGMPPVPAGTPTANLNDARMPVAMERIAAGTMDVLGVLNSLREVARAVGATTDFREGRFYHEARGIAKSWEEVIRLRELNNLPTAAHEVGHIVMKAVFGTMNSTPLMQATFPKPVNAELLSLGKKLYGSRRPAAGYTAEGFSELVRLWLSTEEAAKVAPQATKWLEETLFPLQATKGPLPGLGAAMWKARDAFDVWRSQGAEARIAAQTKDEPGRIARLKRWAKENLSYRATVEEFAPLEELSKAYTAATGNRLAPGSNPYLLASALRATAGAKLETWIEHGMTNVTGTVTGPSLREAVARVKPAQADKFELYLTALQAIERVKQGKNPGIEAEDAIYVRDKYAREHPEFVDAAEKWADWWDGVLQYKRDAYPEVNGQMVDAIRKANPRYYGPLARVLDPAAVRADRAGGTGGGLHRFKGSGLPIKKLLFQSLQVAEGMIADAHRDMALRSVVKLAQTPGMGWVLEQVPLQRVLEQVNVEKLRAQLENFGVDTSTIPADTLLEYASLRDTPTGADPIIAVRGGAGVQWYQVPAQVYEILQGVQEPARLGPLFEIFAGMPARLKRMGTTGLRASFALVTNPIRDLPTFMLQGIAGNPAQRAATYVQTFFDVVRAGLGGNVSPALQLVQELGLQSSTFLGGDIAQARREARALFHGRWYRRAVNPLETLREILSFTETVPRVAELTLVGRELGWKPGAPLTLDQAAAMMLAFKRVTTDFTAKGSQWAGYRRATPFVNAGVQGARAFARAFGRDQGTKEKGRAALRALLNGLTLLTVPALWNWWQNRDEDWYKMLPWRERYLYLNVAAGRNIYQVPMPQEWGVAFGVLPVALFDSWFRRDPEPAKQALKHMFSVINPLDLPVLPAAAKEQMQNRVEFFDRPIVPRGELDLLPGLQRSPYSSEVAKELGNIFPNQISPRRFDAAVREVVGGVGADVADAPGALMRALGLRMRERQRELEASDTPIFGRLARRGGQFTGNSQPLVEFWDDLTRYRTLMASNRKAVAQKSPDLAPVTFKQQAYASRLAALEPWIRLRLELAERTPELDKRQAIYRAASERAAKLVAERPEE